MTMLWPCFCGKKIQKHWRGISLLRWMLGPREKINSQRFVLKIYFTLGDKLIIASWLIITVHCKTIAPHRKTELCIYVFILLMSVIWQLLNHLVYYNNQAYFWSISFCNFSNYGKNCDSCNIPNFTFDSISSTKFSDSICDYWRGNLDMFHSLRFYILWWNSWQEAFRRRSDGACMHCL